MCLDNSYNQTFIKRSGLILFNYLDTTWSKHLNCWCEEGVNCRDFFRTVLRKLRRKCNRITIILLVVFCNFSGTDGVVTNVQLCERKEGDICGEILSSSAAIASRVADCTRPRRFKTVPVVLPSRLVQTPWHCCHRWSAGDLRTFFPQQPSYFSTNFVSFM